MIEGLEAELHSFAERLADGDPDLAREAEEDSGAFVGEELRRMIDRAVRGGRGRARASPALGNRRLLPPDARRSLAGRAGVFFATRTPADGRRGVRLPLLALSSSSRAATWSAAIWRSCGESTPRAASRPSPRARPRRGLGSRRQQSIVAEHNERTDLRAEQEQIGPRQRWALDLLRDPSRALRLGSDRARRGGRGALRRAQLRGPARAAARFRTRLAGFRNLP